MTNEPLSWDSKIGPHIPPTFDSEQALIACALFSDVDRPAALAAVPHTDFMNETCRAIWRVLQAMHRAGETIDPVSVAGRTTKRLQARLDAGYFFNLAALRPTHVGWESEAARIKAAARRRRIAETAQAMTQKVNDNDDPDAIIAEAQATLARMATVAAGDAPESVYELATQEIDHGETLLGDGECRYLERGAVLMLAAPSGVGKSHLAAQAAVSWACGRAVFGLRPHGDPLRSLIVQAENPPNDSRAIAAGMIRGLALSNSEAAAVHERTRQVWLPGCTGDAFLSRLRAMLAAWPCDVVIVDPLGGFVAGDLTKPETVQAFCRSGLGALAVQCRVALFVCHHIPKPTAAKDKRKMGSYDWQYAGAGSADLTANWPRAVLSMEAIERGQFVLHAGKRRPPWVDDQGQQAWEIGVRHSEAMVWETFELPKEQRKAGRQASPDPSTYAGAVTELFRVHGPMCKDVFESRLQAAEVPRDKGRACISLLIEGGVLAQWKGRGNAKIVGLAAAEPNMDKEGRQ
ncbi:MAG: AAA family ATPase [Kiritimatiellae bacterium]|nr:AAA family ATPase [Kiritimatiellia bacterium]